MRKILFVLLLFVACSVLASEKLRSIPIGVDEHIMISGDIYDNPTITRVCKGRVLWSEPLFQSSHCTLDAVPENLEWQITVQEGMEQVYVYLSIDGSILSSSTQYLLLTPKALRYFILFGAEYNFIGDGP